MPQPHVFTNLRVTPSVLWVQETGDALALAGLVCAMLTDIAQFLYMFRRLNILEAPTVLHPSG